MSKESFISESRKLLTSPWITRARPPRRWRAQHDHVAAQVHGNDARAALARKPTGLQRNKFEQCCAAATALAESGKTAGIIELGSDQKCDAAAEGRSTGAKPDN